ncbi:hypothetical protein [Pararcticibacter amylolyticus]|uniref:Nuclear transport factor 2 family protein n=1 Tax=Pararcticibacter amylolyticus TaxID=2173175 RepID=A0A2U2PKX6_9SPHI|nr:hypothetical protein [Pararcticibacter amylolyticus]PWG82050.1 hypothetical protein DDR33_03250 [Pararcticibacter amylolyticus]
MINIQEIDKLTEQFYKGISFSQEHYPQFDQLGELFFGAGKLIDNNYDKPIDFTLQSYIQAVMRQIEDGNASFYSQQEISDTTEVFGNTAQRISVYEYSFTAETQQPWKKGVNYIQFIFTEGKWQIVSMVWTDETEEFSIPETYLI